MSRNIPGPQHKKTTTSFTRKINSVHSEWYIDDVSVLRTACVKNLYIILGCKLYFHQYVNYVRVCSELLKLRLLIRFTTNMFNSAALCVALIRLKLEHASMA
jgi:hypothetical protein